MAISSARFRIASTCVASMQMLVSADQKRKGWNQTWSCEVGGFAENDVVLCDRRVRPLALHLAPQLVAFGAGLFLPR
eukprot:2509337-Rhodomonas_salina.1